VEWTIYPKITTTMIQSFTNADTEELFHKEKNRRFSVIARVALRKLIQLNRAEVLSDLRVPPGNRLEALKGNWVGFYSIRVNDQWRIVFRWSDAGPTEVAILDYH
jgi:toxin HigB-1